MLVSASVWHRAVFWSNTSVYKCDYLTGTIWWTVDADTNIKCIYLTVKVTTAATQQINCFSVSRVLLLRIQVYCSVALCHCCRWRHCATFHKLSGHTDQRQGVTFQNTQIPKLHFVQRPNNCVEKLMLHILKSHECKVVPVHILKAHRRRGSTAPPILYVSTGWTWVGIFTPWPFESQSVLLLPGIEPRISQPLG
jgi:hypothetical protein